MAVDIVPRKATGAALGVVGISSYVAAGLQDITSGLLAHYDFESVDGTTLRITHVNVLDGTPEACESTVYPTLSAQFDLSGDHPLYEKFLKLMEEGKRNA